MQLKHSFTVPTDLEQAWQVLLDIERIAPCMPGAAIETVAGDDFTGTVKVRLGPIGLTYRGKASFVEKDAAAHRAVIDAQGKDARGNGTAKARITATLTAQSSSGTTVDVVTDLNITGKPAQFGRGVMVDVGNKLIGQFADCLAGTLSGPAAGGQDRAGLTTSAGTAGLVTSDSGTAGLATSDSGTAGRGATGLGASDLDTAVLPTVDPAIVDPATVERLAAADLVGEEKLGTADADSAEIGVSAPDADRSAVATGQVEFGAGSPAPEQPSAGAVGMAEPGVVEDGLAEVRTVPAVTADSPVAGPGLARTAGEAVVAVPGPAPEETPVEPDTAAEAAPPGQRLDDAGAASPGGPSRPAPEAARPTAAQPPAPRPMAADVEPIDLLGSAGPAVAKRLAPVAAGAVLLLLLLLRQRRRSAARSAVEQARADYRAAVKRWAEAERRAAMERRNLSRTARAGSPSPAAGWRAWPAVRTGGRRDVGPNQQAG